jgi:immune inhibitor A
MLALLIAAGSSPGTAIPPYPPGEMEQRTKDPFLLRGILESVARHQSTTRREPVTYSGVFKIPIILVDFADNEAHSVAYPATHYETLLFDRTPGARSLFDYYKENSYGAFDVQGTVTPWLRSNYLYNGHYVNADRVLGTNDDHGFDTSAASLDGMNPPRNVWGLVKEAVELADPYLDFGEFDNDGDGEVDAIIVVHAGCGAEFQSCQPAADQIWSHQSSLREFFEARASHFLPIVADGVEANIYTLNPEDGQLGVFAHEFGHTLGLPDFYNTINLESRVGRFCLMDYGGWSGWPVGSGPSHLSSWCKSFLGWIEPEAIDSITDPPPYQIHSITLPAIEEEPVAVRILDNPNGVDWTPVSLGMGEYFLVENRQLLGYDADLFTTLGTEAEGLLILHIDESLPGNNRSDRLLVSVVQADGGSMMLLGTGHPEDLWKPGQEFGPSTIPSSDLYGGVPSSVSISGIQDIGADQMRASVTRGETPPSPELDIRPNPWVTEQSAEGVHISYKPESQSRTLRVWIYTLTGALVRVLDESPEVSPGGGYARWDGTNEEGDPVAGGVYFIVVSDGNQQTTGKIAVVR